ncbi:zinc finger, C3HC4 type (RING finger) domain-containing protein [Besnoitia besnoiti]|uniref:Zinc finger, C3HC4 type (RING finger) domain-containing protein n=1 Tax=Besnoitia besnoiti TaxID=94643 RepID=A0A2A9MJ04_BESBE|nr:zinc finger, C3HC4 type (RING finger) domain-containing protein [Besnoitia besnoiti]PFH37899.1 zinc finger, C3HC4 type (RING finger) domain-containing protein [Besnoitia besnoiti]
MEPSLSLACEAVRLLQLHGVSPLLSSPLTQDCLRLPAAAPASARSTRASPPPLCAFYSSFSPDVSSPPFEDDAAPPSRRAGPGAQPLPCGLLSSAPATPLDVPACIRRPDIGASASPFCSRRPRATHPPSPSSPSSSRPSSSSDFSSCPSSSSQACACCEASVESSSLCAAAVFKETDARRASKRRARDSSASFSSGAAATCAYPPSGCRFFFAAHAPSSARVVCCVWARRRADADASRSREGGNEREEKQRERCCCREREAASCEAILTSAVLQAAAPQGEDDDPSRGEAEEDAGEGERTAEDSLRLDGIRAASASCAFTRGSGRDLAGSWEEACGRAPCCATRMEEQRWSVPIARRGEEEVCSVVSGAKTEGRQASEKGEKAAETEAQRLKAYSADELHSTQSTERREKRIGRELFTFSN